LANNIKALNSGMIGFFAKYKGQKGGWVAAQVFQLIADSEAVAIEDYTARELDVNEGDIVISMRVVMAGYGATKTMKLNWAGFHWQTSKHCKA
jgi:hypothetical protein